MKNFGIKIQEWLRVAFSVPITGAPSTNRVERRRRKRRPFAINHSLHPRCVYLELVNRNAGRVSVTGSFNDWRPTATPMISMGGGWWVKALVLPPGRHEYRFVVDDQEMPDPNSLQTEHGADGRVNSVLVVPEQTGT